MAKISVIIPVYNAEKYIEQCISSIANQTLKDIEIIAINDGSIDNSLNITIPTLSNICSQMPNALELDLYMFKGYIADSVVKHLYFGEQDFLLSEASFNLLNKKNVKCEAIDNLEPYKQMKKLK